MSEYEEPGPLETWTVYASSGEYQVPAESAGHAFLRFAGRHPDDHVTAIVCGEPAFDAVCTAVADSHPDMPLLEVVRAAGVLASDRRVAYTALCVSSGSEPQETLTALVRRFPGEGPS